MKILKSWLQDYIDITNISDSDLDDKITFSGIEVEGIEKAIDDRVIVAEILEVKPHPNADRLRIARVNTGGKELEIVCGAPNIEAGQKVPLAQVGAILPGDFEIKEAVIRGIPSQGMLCAEDELGLGADHAGILILPADAKPGERVNEILSSDTIFDLKPTPNRGDCFSHLGVAREIAAVLDQKLSSSSVIPSAAPHRMVQGAVEGSYNTTQTSDNKDLSTRKDPSACPPHEASADVIEMTDGESIPQIDISDPDGCPAYYGVKISGVKIAESPDWLKKRLLAVGAKPINNVVDITNYVMLDMGQPLHAFDATKVVSEHIIVRRANEGEEIITLDGNLHTLTANNLLITDPEKPIAIAGIMGGQNSEIGENTTEIILESAEFSPTVIRKSAKVLGLSTEASYRYERGVDPLGTEKASRKAVQLILEIAGGEVVGRNQNIAKPFEPKSIAIPYDNINSLLGLSLDPNEINNLLMRLGFEITDNTAHIPSWRRDIHVWQDLSEEVGRIYGLNNIPVNDLPGTATPTKSDYYKKEYLKDILVDQGFTEVASYSIISSEDVKVAKLDAENLLEIANPVQPENKFMRNSLIPGLLKTIAKNPTFDPILIFEIGNVFTKDSELTNIALAASGKDAKKALSRALEATKNELTIKRDIEIEELTRDELVRYKIRKPVTYYVELNAKDLIDEANFGDKDLSLKISNKPVHYRSISKFPAVTRDLAFIVDVNTDADAIENDIYEQSELINRVELFDEFASDKFGEGKKNIAYHLYLQHPDRTLTDQEANEVINSTIKAIEIKYKAKLRE